MYGLFEKPQVEGDRLLRHGLPRNGGRQSFPGIHGRLGVICIRWERGEERTAGVGRTIGPSELA